MRVIQNFILGLQFLTRINITKKSMPCEKEDFKGAMNFFVVLGLIVGALQYLTYCIFSTVGNELFGAFMAALAGIYFTGGIHLDGLADIFDGFGANASPERTLDIMKDSCCGTFGVVALMVDVLFHVTAFYALKDYPLVIILIPMAGKLGICLLCKLGKNLRQGLGALWIENIGPMGLIINVVVMALVTFLVLGDMVQTVLLLGVIAAQIYYLNKKYTNKLGNLTGDCLGATNQFVEWMVLTYLVVIFN